MGAYEGLMEAQICVGVCDGSLRPQFNETCPLPYQRLAIQCWAQNPEDRQAHPHKKRTESKNRKKEKKVEGGGGGGGGGGGEAKNLRYSTPLRRKESPGGRGAGVYQGSFSSMHLTLSLYPSIMPPGSCTSSASPCL